MDQDGDKVTCRWSKEEECASVCNALPYAMIDPVSLSISSNVKTFHVFSNSIERKETK